MVFIPLFLAAAAVLAPPGAPATVPPKSSLAVVAPHAAKPRKMPPAPAQAHWLSPTLHVAPGPQGSPHVALTLDACTGSVDSRILDALIANDIKATIFVTARWLKRNPQALARIMARSDLFSIENHGARHLAAITRKAAPFGVHAAGSPEALRREINEGSAAIAQATGRTPTWYRGAAAEYSADAPGLIADMGLRLGGYSLSGDGGATYSAKRAAAAVSAARNGDVIIAHINQPNRPAGEGVVQGLLALKAKGFVFVKLAEKTIAH